MKMGPTSKAGPIGYAFWTIDLVPDQLGYRGTFTC
jgi:hypothetical protein